LKEAVGAMNSN